MIKNKIKMIKKVTTHLKVNSSQRAKKRLKLFRIAFPVTTRNQSRRKVGCPLRYAFKTSMRIVIQKKENDKGKQLCVT